ncbi:PLDc N-terminal domain-containing protein [Roseivirga sp.]|uniref:PLDc N-terminal domain-containing protein n=1 Tax=Roseivirga sp. TaxID=1964215 RepID=UPI003B5184A4
MSSVTTDPYFYALLFVLAVLILLPAMVLLNIIQSRFEDNVLKLIWVIVVLSLPVIGILMYLIWGRKQRLAG